MTSEYFTSRFVEQSPAHLKKIYNQKLISSLLSLLNVAARGLKKDYSELINMINFLNPNKKLNQQLYAAHASLTDSLKINDVKEVQKLLPSI